MLLQTTLCVALMCVALTGSNSDTERLGFVFNVGIRPVRERPLRCPFFFSPSVTGGALVLGLSTSASDGAAGAAVAEALLAALVATADGAAVVVGM